MIIETAFVALLTTQPLLGPIKNPLQGDAAVEMDTTAQPYRLANKDIYPPRNVNRPPPPQRSQQGGKGKNPAGLPPWCKPKGHMDCSKGKDSKS